jgi:hypothetical protein
VFFVVLACWVIPYIKLVDDMGMKKQTWLIIAFVATGALTTYLAWKG